MNVACGGTLYQDVGKELSEKLGEDRRVVHMDYDDYDGHRHVVSVVEKTPLHSWFKDSLEVLEIKDSILHIFCGFILFFEYILRLYYCTYIFRFFSYFFLTNLKKTYYVLLSFTDQVFYLS